MMVIAKYSYSLLVLVFPICFAVENGNIVKETQKAKDLAWLSHAMHRKLCMVYDRDERKCFSPAVVRCFSRWTQGNTVIRQMIHVGCWP